MQWVFWASVKPNEAKTFHLLRKFNPVLRESKCRNFGDCPIVTLKVKHQQETNRRKEQKENDLANKTTRNLNKNFLLASSTKM